MSKTAREVIAEHLQGACEELGKGGGEIGWAEQVIADLNEAGFVIAPKELIAHLVAALNDISSMPHTPSDELASATNVADSALHTYRAMIAAAEKGD